ncbi:hypothetical protein LGM65_24970 [Burkholderia anthina]|nr:hypothetical protein [Burkholderia anthina]
MLTVWGRRNSFNVQKVMWLVGELALAHRHEPARVSHAHDDPVRRSARTARLLAHEADRVGGTLRAQQPRLPTGAPAGCARIAALALRSP